MARLVLHDAALADGTSGSLRTGVSLAIEGGQIAWIRPNDSADTTGAEVIDAGGATIVPAMVDCHSHLTMQGGSHWIARGEDPAPVLQQVARDNAKRLAQAGILWARDVGAPMSDGMPAFDRPPRRAEGKARSAVHPRGRHVDRQDGLSRRCGSPSMARS